MSFDTEPLPVTPSKQPSLTVYSAHTGWKTSMNHEDEWLADSILDECKAVKFSRREAKKKKDREAMADKKAGRR